MKFLAQIIVVVLLFNTSHSFSQTLRLTNNVQYVQIGDMDVPGNQITVECLVKRTGGTNILSKHTGPSNVNYLMRIGTFELTTANGFYLMNNPYAGSMSTTSWYHVSGTYDGSNNRYYVTGCLVVQQAATGNLTQRSEIFRLLLMQSSFTGKLMSCGSGMWQDQQQIFRITCLTSPIRQRRQI